MGLNVSISSMNNSLQEHIAKEEEFTKATDAVLEQANRQKEEESVLYSKEMTAMQEHIDKQWHQNVKKMEKIYSVPPEIKEKMKKRKEQYEEQEAQQNWFAKRLV